MIPYVGRRDRCRRCRSCLRCNRLHLCVVSDVSRGASRGGLFVQEAVYCYAGKMNYHFRTVVILFCLLILCEHVERRTQKISRLLDIKDG